VQGWWSLIIQQQPEIGRWVKRSLARLKGFEAADLDKRCKPLIPCALW
jgi:hypothetical protein